MSWKFTPSFLGGNQPEQSQPNLHHTSTESWYFPSVSGSLSSSNALGRAAGRTQSPSQLQPSPSEAAAIISRLRDKSVDELRKLVDDPNAYASFFNSLDQVQMQNGVRDELRKETLQLARENLEKEPQILELRNQCMIIRTTELAAAQEKLTELETQKQQISHFYSPASLLTKLHDAMDKTDEESKLLERQLLEKEIDLATFLQKYKKLRQVYHRQALLHLAARTNA